MNHLLNRTLLFCILFFAGLSATAQDKVLLCTGKSSHSYHKERCMGLKQCRATVVTVLKKDAIKAGKDACDFCYGHNADNGQTKPKSSSGQCAAVTKKGSQCSRAASTNGYCWQHSK